MDIEASKNDNNLEEESYENSIEAEDDDNLIEEVETIQEDYITDEYDNVIIHDSDIDNGEENYNDVDEFKAESEDSFSERLIQKIIMKIRIIVQNKIIVELLKKEKKLMMKGIKMVMKKELKMQ